jgi:hypothetical protein
VVAGLPVTGEKTAAMLDTYGTKRTLITRSRFDVGNGGRPPQQLRRQPRCPPGPVNGGRRGAATRNGGAAVAAA